MLSKNKQLFFSILFSFIYFSFLFYVFLRVETISKNCAKNGWELPYYNAPPYLRVTRWAFSLSTRFASAQGCLPYAYADQYLCPV